LKLRVVVVAFVSCRVLQVVVVIADREEEEEEEEEEYKGEKERERERDASSSSSSSSSSVKKKRRRRTSSSSYRDRIDVRADNRRRFYRNRERAEEDGRQKRAKVASGDPIVVE